ncbi:MAG: YgjV family protein [Oscillospiraceae bacterium]|nr:YgjV family protein [Oscillospiraceae bacterium]
MSGETILQLVGYFSTLLILVSFLMTSVVKLRLVNLVGSAIFVVFAFLTKSYPTAIMNVGLCIINIYFLIRLLRAKRLTLMLPIDLDSAYLREFLKLYREDIRTYFPAFDADAPGVDAAYFVYYDMDPVGLTMGNRLADGALDIRLDYTIPKYRDASVGRFLYPHLLGEEGFTALEFRNASEKHEKYLQKVGFRKEGDCWRLTKG